MKNNNLGRLFGGSLIIAGTTLGAGVLAIPITSAYLGFTTSACLMLAVCVVMTYAALFTVEINIHFNKSINISSAAEKVLGSWGRSLASFSMMLLHFALLAAYASGGASILKTALSGLGVPANTIALQLLFTISLAFFIYSATRAVDFLNRFLFAFKLIFFLTLIFILAPAVTDENLFSTSSHFIPLYAVIPVFVTSFGYHGSLHSIVQYIGPEHPRRLILAIALGSFIAFIFYFAWQFVSIGALPLFGEASFENVFTENNDVGTFISQLNNLFPGNTINWASNGFSGIAIATSFLGVGLGLFDFFLQKIHASNTPKGRFKSAAYTFIIPLVFAIYYPQGFIMALGFAGLALTIIAIILPSLIILKLRKSPTYNPKFKTPGGTIAIRITLLIGIAIIACEALKWT